MFLFCGFSGRSVHTPWQQRRWGPKCVRTCVTQTDMYPGLRLSAAGQTSLIPPQQGRGKQAWYHPSEGRGKQAWYHPSEGRVDGKLIATQWGKVDSSLCVVLLCGDYWDEPCVLDHTVYGSFVWRTLVIKIVYLLTLCVVHIGRILTKMNLL